MKKKILLSLAAITIIFLGTVIYTQIWKPLVIKPKEAQCIVWDATYDAVKAKAEDALADEYDKTSFFIHSFDGVLPSDNPDDYMSVYCTLQVKNRSIFHMNSVNAVVLELNNYEKNVLFSDSSDTVVSGGLWRFTTEDETFRLIIYIADMDETAIRDLIKGLKAKVTFEGDFIGVREKIIDFADCDNVIVDFGNE